MEWTHRRTPTFPEPSRLRWRLDRNPHKVGRDAGDLAGILPLLVSGVCADIAEIRIQELFNYALYDQPEAVRTIIGFGQPMDQLPLMLHDFALEMVWAPTTAPPTGPSLRRGRASIGSSSPVIPT